jgi:hypothetical protein
MYFEAHKLNVVTEKFVARKVCKMLTEKGAKGYTLIMAGAWVPTTFTPMNPRPRWWKTFLRSK